LLAEVRKHSGRTTFRVRLDQSGSQLLSVLGRARTPLFYERDGYHTSPGIKYCCRKCLLSSEVRKHSGRTAFRVRIDQSGSQLLSVLGWARTPLLYPLWSCHQIAEGQGLGVNERPGGAFRPDAHASRLTMGKAAKRLMSLFAAALAGNLTMGCGIISVQARQ